MKTDGKYAIRCLASGVIVLTLFVVLMFWLRWACTVMQRDGSDPGRQRHTVNLSPLPIMPSEMESDPNIVRPSSLSVDAFGERIQGFRTMGLLPVRTGTVGPYAGINPDVYWWEPPLEGQYDGSWLYLDRKTGLIVYRCAARLFDPNAGPGTTAQWYAGPEGMAQTAEASLGRFESPIASMLTPFVYDARLRRFFRLDWPGHRVIKGPELDQADPHRPIQIGTELWKSGGCLSISRVDPMRQVGTKENGDPNLVPVAYLSSRGGLIPVLDASGRIDMLDPTTLTITAVAGYLPSMEGPFDSTERSAAHGLFAYQVAPVWLRPTGPWSSDPPQYLGCTVAAINRGATEFSVQVFDRNGTPVAWQTRSIVQRERGLAAMESLVENLHPPCLSVLSEVTAPYIEARSGAHGVFILPNSLIAARGRVLNEIWIVRIAAGLGVIWPSLVLVAILAWLVGRDARLFGLPKSTRRLWILGTAAFGIPACITYLLMRPRTVLVTCRNCGRPRRPDLERCHRCDSPWDMPELNPPAWRVFDGAASAAAMRA